MVKPEDTRASLPGRIKLDIRHWLSIRPDAPFCLTALVVVPIILGIMYHWGWYFVLPFALKWKINY